MPKAGNTVESCIMGAWKKKVGDTVAEGDILFTYETDKAEFECESTAAGTLLEVFFNEGDEVPCLINVCAVGNAGEDVSALRPDGAAAAEPAPAAAPAEAAAPAAAPAPVKAAPTGPVAQAVVMPKAGITVESCIMGSWKKNVGDTVAEGDILFTYETDKAEFECESTAAGTLLATFFGEGDEVPCLENVCAIGNAGDDTESLRPGAAVEAAPAAEAAAPAAAPVAVAAPTATVSATGIVAVSPRAKKLAERANVDPTLATATGPNGRIIERDVRKLMEEGVPAAKVETAPAAVAAPAAAPAAAAPAVEAEYEDVKFSQVRKVTSKAMMASLSGTAQLTLNFSFDATQIQQYRAMVKPMEGPLSKISLNDMVMYAVAKTLPEFGDINANMLDDTTIRKFKNVNLGFACDTARGLLVPVIKNANKMSLLELANACKSLAGDAKEGKINPDDMSGGTFTVSNLGGFGCESFTPVINPPQTCILGICNIQTKIKSAKDGNITTYPAMGLSLTIDHRAVDGAPAARFMAQLCKNLENFMTLLAQ